MATKDINIDIEIAHYNNFKHYINWPDDICRITIEQLLYEGLIQVSTVFEKAISEVGDIKIVSEDNRDFHDYSDAKLSTVRTSNHGRTYSANISGVHSKVGTLRIQVYERKQEKFYYFLIPYTAFKDIPKTSNIEIPFEKDGTPRRTPKGKRKYPNWWDFEVLSFYQMSSSIIN